MTSLALRFLLPFEFTSDVIFLAALCGVFVFAVEFGQSSTQQGVTGGTPAVFRSLVRVRRAAERALARALLTLQAIARPRPQGQPGVLARGDLAAQLALEVQSPAAEATVPQAAPPEPPPPPQESPPPAALPVEPPAPPLESPAPPVAPGPESPPPAPPPPPPPDTAAHRPPVGFWVLGHHCYTRPTQRIADDALFWRYKAKMEELGGFFLPPDLSFEFPAERGVAVQDALVALGLCVVVATEDKLPVAFAGRPALVRLYAYLRYLAAVDPKGRVVVAFGSSYIATAMSRGRKVADQFEAERALLRAGLSGPKKGRTVDGGNVRAGLRALKALGYVQFEGPEHARTYVLPADATSQTPGPGGRASDPPPPTVDPVSDPVSDPPRAGRINRSAEGGSTDPRRADQPIRPSSDHDHRHDHIDDPGFGPSPGGGPLAPVAPPGASDTPPPSDAPRIHLAQVAPQGKAPEPLPDELAGLGLESVVVRFHGQGPDVLRRVIVAVRRVKWKMAHGYPVRNFPGAVTSAFLNPQDWEVPAEALRDPAPPKAKGSDLVAIRSAIQPPPVPDEPAPEPASDAPPLWRAVVKVLLTLATEGTPPIACWAAMAHCTSAEGGVFRLRKDLFLRDQLARPEIRAVLDQAFAAAGAAGGRIEWEDGT